MERQSKAAFRDDLLAGRRAFITGGGTGICRGIALAFAAHGADVAIVSRKPEHLEPTARELAALGVRAFAPAADVRDPAESVAAAIDGAVAASAASTSSSTAPPATSSARAEDLSPNGFGTVVDIDLKGSFNVAKAALPHLRKAGGVLLNISATLHYLGTASQVHVVGGQGRRRLADPHARGRVGALRHSRQRHRTRCHRRHRGREAPAGG